MPAESKLSWRSKHRNILSGYLPSGREIRIINKARVRSASNMSDNVARQSCKSMIDMNDRSSSFEPLKLVVKKLDLPHNNIFKAIDVLFREERFNVFPSLAVEVVRYGQMVRICAIVL